MTAHAGVDLGGTKIQSVVVNEDLDVLGSCFLLTPRDAGPAGVVGGIIDAIRSALKQAGLSQADLTSVGIGSPGRIDTRAGTVTHAGNLPDWTGTEPVSLPVSQSLGCPVTLRGDVQSGVMAEWHRGAGRGFASMLGVFCGTGVGGGLILGGELWRSRGAAGEVGHMVARNGGRACPCGLRGCLEAYAGRAPMEAEARRLAQQGASTALFDLMRQMDREIMTGEVWAAALAESDPLAARLMDENVEAMGVVLASAVNLLDVEAVVIGGGMGQALGEPYVDRVRAAMAEHLVFPDNPLTVRSASLGDLAGAVGAALAAQEESR